MAARYHCTCTLCGSLMHLLTLLIGKLWLSQAIGCSFCQSIAMQALMSSCKCCTPAFGDRLACYQVFCGNGRVLLQLVRVLKNKSNAEQAAETSCKTVRFCSANLTAKRTFACCDRSTWVVSAYNAVFECLPAQLEDSDLCACLVFLYVSKATQKTADVTFLHTATLCR